MSEKFTIEIKKRPVYEWLFWVIWVIGLVFVFQNAEEQIGRAHV